MKEIWLRHKNPGNTIFAKESKYLLYDVRSYNKLYSSEGGYKDLFCIQKYFKNDNGEWERCYDSYFYITIEDLLTDFILIDGPFEKELNKLTEQIADYFKANLDDTLKPMENIWEIPINPEDIKVKVITPENTEE